MGKLVVFNRILGKYPDMQILLGYASANMTPALRGGNDVIKTNKTYWRVLRQLVLKTLQMAKSLLLIMI